jgi:hypothetical protein
MPLIARSVSPVGLEPTVAGKLLLGWGLAGVTGGLCLALLICIEWPWSFPAHGFAHFVPVPDIASYDFDRDLVRAGVARGAQRAHFYAAAEQDAIAVLRVSPAKPAAWLQLAYVRTLAHGFQKDASDALARSYGVAPLEPTVAIWRITFSLNQWDQLTPDLKSKVSREIEAMWTLGPDAQIKLAQAVSSVRKINGRAAGQAILIRAGWNPQSP